MKIVQLRALIDSINSDTSAADISARLFETMKEEKGKHWNKYAEKFYEFAETMEPQFSIFSAAGNRKLPFLSFSVLPFTTCPGAGDCLNFCYSQKAWRYPAAFCRQLQNTVLMNKRPDIIAAEFSRVLDTPKFANQEKVDFRLYVDGDFSNMQDFKFWQDTLKKFPRVAAYGYSKSWNEILEFYTAGNTAAPNYVLNLSSGSNHNAATENKMRALDITRGRFVAVSMPGHWKQSAGHTAEYKAADTMQRAIVRCSFSIPSYLARCKDIGGRAAT